MGKPLRKLLKRKSFPEITDVFRIKIAISHLDADVREVVLHRIDVGITHCLRTVHADWCIKKLKLLIDTLDFIDGHLYIVRKHRMIIVVGITVVCFSLCAIHQNSVRSSLDDKLILRFLDGNLKRHLRMVI